jgi:hypothetical protein
VVDRLFLIIYHAAWVKPYFGSGSPTAAFSFGYNPIGNQVLRKETCRSRLRKSRNSGAILTSLESTLAKVHQNKGLYLPLE